MTTLKELNDLCDKMYKLKKEADTLKKQSEEKNKQVFVMKSQILDIFAENNMEKHSGTFGTVSTAKRFSAKMPKTQEGREAFFEYLKKQGTFDNLITINSQTLKGWLKAELLQKGEKWQPPGIEEYGETIEVRMGK